MERQKYFFEIIKNKLAKNIRLADTICDILNISSDSAYRRLRGEKELSLSELSTLCSHFDISMDSILNYNSDYSMFKYSPLDISNIDAYYNYMEHITALYEGLVSAEEKSISATAQDILMFHFLPYTDLTFFKLYAWYQSSSVKYMAYNDFIKKLDRERLEGLYKRISNAYKQVPSLEIWSVNTIDAIISAIDYYYDMKCFEDNKFPNKICAQLLQLIDDVNKQAEDGHKEYKGRKALFSMYLSPISLENNFIITNRDGNKAVSLKLYTINGIFSSNAVFCSETEKWVKNLISMSSNISGASARERFLFFQNMKNKVNNLMGKFNND